MNVLEGNRFEQRRILFEGRPEWAASEGEELVFMDGRRIAEAEAVYLPPCDPTKILCIHLNYDSRRVEFRAPDLVTPTYFQKPTTALNSHRGVLNRPGNCQYIVRGVDVRESTVRTYINGDVVQEGPVSEMVFGIDYQLADLCRHITLLPGDIVLTGTPANSRPMQPGDLVEVEVTGLGRLENRVADIAAPAHDVGHQPTDTDSVRRVALGGDWWAEKEANG
jgi:2-keto-4-pentenoate hydratase/2-oxohepta-3-ene-1,7-dioic acid hydratase in catechol pathway